MIGLFALLHGNAHGTEVPENVGGLEYMAGFAVATALLHLAGIAAALGLGLRFRSLVQVAGAACAAIGTRPRLRRHLRDRAMIPGEVITAAGDIELNKGALTVSLKVANTGDRPIQVGSHYHFFETNERAVVRPRPSARHAARHRRRNRRALRAWPGARRHPGAARRQARGLRLPAKVMGKL